MDSIENAARLAFLDANREGNDTIIQELIESDNINYQLPSKSMCNSIPEDLEGCTALHIATKNQDLNRIKKLLKNGADISLKDAQGMTALHRAIECERSSIHPFIHKLRGQLKDATINLLLSAHIDLNVIENPYSENGISHLHASCITNNVPVLEFLLKNEASANETVHEISPILTGYTPLHFTARYSNAKVAKSLLDHGAQPRMKDAQGLTPLHILIQRNMEIADWMNMGKRARCGFLKKEYNSNERIVKAILEKTGEEVIDDTGLARLHVACTSKDTSILDKMLKEMTDIEHCVKKTSSLWPGYTALHFAAHFNLAAFKMLMNYGANTLTRADNQFTPLDLCLQRYQAEVVHDLIESQPNWKNIQFSDGQTNLLDFIHSMKDIDAFKQFYDSKIEDINMFIPHDSPIFPGYTPLHIVTLAHERVRCITDLIKDTLYETQNECPYQQNSKGSEESALYSGRIKVCLDRKPDLNARDYYKSTALHLAFKLQRGHIVEMMMQTYIQSNSCENCIDEDGLSHFQIACAAGDKKLAELLISKNRADCLENSSLLKEYEYSRKGSSLQSFPVIFNAASTSLHIAVVIRHFEMVKYFVHCGYDVHTQDAEGMSPIHRSIVVPEICNYLLNSTIKNLRNRVADCGLSHLHVACAVKNVEAVAVLIINGADLNATVLMDYEEDASLRGLTALQIAIRSRNREIVKLLIGAGAKIVTGYFFDQRYENCNEIFECHVAKNKAVNEVENMTELHVACYVIDVDGVKILLNEGADPNARCHSSHPIWANYTPLHLLASVYRCDRNTNNVVNSIIKMLIEHGADVTSITGDNDTPLHKAFYKICRAAHEGKTGESRARKTSEGNLVPKRLDALLNMPPADLVTQLRYGWNDNDRSPNICLKEGDPLRFRRVRVSDSTDGIRGKVGYTQGLHVWEIHCNSERCGTHVGVATAEAPLHADGHTSLIGSCEHSWGWDIADIHKQTSHVPDRITVILDMDEGTLAYMVDNMYLGVAFKDLKGKTIYPAASTTRDDVEVSMRYIGGIENDDQFGATLDVLLGGHQDFNINPMNDKGISVFHIACLCNNTSVVQKFLEHGVNVNQPIDNFCEIYAGCTPLHLAAYHKHTETVDLLIKYGADLHVKNREGNTPLHLASNYSDYLLSKRSDEKLNENVLISLIRAGADVKAKNRFDQMPIEMLMETKGLNNKTAEIFLGNHANSNLLNYFDMSSIAPALATFLENQVNVNVFNNFDMSYITPALTTFLENQPNVNVFNYFDMGFITPALNILWENQPDINVFNYFDIGSIAPSLTSYWGNQVNVNVFNCFDMGFIATAISRESTIEDILNHPVYTAVVNYPEVNGPDNMGRTPIHNIVSLSPCDIASEMYLEAIEGLAKLNFDIDQYDHEGRTPLHYAVKFKNLGAISALLNLGVDFNIVDVDGETPYSLALKLKKEESDVNHNVEYRRMFEIFATHVYKLKFVGLEINEVNEDTNHIYQKQFGELDDEEFLESLENVKIGTCGFSLREFLSSENATLLYENMDKETRESFDEFFRTGIKQFTMDYAEWIGILRMQYRKVRAKTTLPPAATEDASILTSLYSYLPWA